MGNPDEDNIAVEICIRYFVTWFRFVVVFIVLEKFKCFIKS